MRKNALAAPAVTRTMRRQSLANGSQELIGTTVNTSCVEVDLPLRRAPILTTS